MKIDRCSPTKIECTNTDGTIIPDFFPCKCGIVKSEDDAVPEYDEICVGPDATCNTSRTAGSRCEAACTTTKGNLCIFPFKFPNTTNTKCIEDDGHGSLGNWCSIKVNSTGHHVTGEGNAESCGANKRCTDDSVSVAAAKTPKKR